MILPSPSQVREHLQRIPTTDLYFRNPLRHLGDQKGAGAPSIRSIAPNVYVVGRTGVVSRYASRADLELLQLQDIRQIVYIADDDFEAGATDPRLPARYRSKLAAFAERAWPFLKAAADIVIVSNPVLGAIYGPKARVLQPVWDMRPATTEHFERPGRFEIVHLGTGSHRADLAPIAAALGDLLSGHPDARLTLFAGANIPDTLRGHPQVRARRPLPWWLYKRLLPRLRFHVALYPLQEGGFNAARSANKLFEQALVGAAGLMSPNPALRDAAGPELRGLFVEDGIEEWRQRIEQDLVDRSACRRRADATRAHILASDALARAVGVWREILSADTLRPANA
jgi:hypothetical protein